MKPILMLLFIVAISLTIKAQKVIPTEDQLKAISMQLNTIRNADKTADVKKSDLKKFILETENQYDIRNLTLSQIKIIASGGSLYAEDTVKDWILPLLSVFAKRPNIEGAEAQGIIVTNYYRTKMDEWIGEYEKLVVHAGIKDFLKTKNYGDVFGRLQFLDKELVGKSSLIKKMIPLLDYEMSDEAKTSSIIFFDVVIDQITNMPDTTIELIRSKVAVLFADLLKTSKSARISEHVKRINEYINSSYAKKTLIYNPAPNIDFKWYSSGDVKRLSDLKGKVVVLDFWAVWCNPCIGSFPNIRKLVERYKNYPVEIIGITSVQGYHMDLKNKKKILLKEQPEEEMRLMTEFMQIKDMTWKVAYSNDCFNPDYGVRGIPHVSIIDPNGIVQFNRLRPYMPPYHEAEKIDSLLKAAGLPYPKQPMEQTNYSNVSD